VTDLLELPTGKITKIAAGGYLLMALTEGNDLYAWGGHPGLPALFDGLSHCPAPVDIEENDIADFSVGTYHAVALTKGGRLFVVGENTNGQLGLPKEQKARAWTSASLTLQPGKTVTSVTCGPRVTLVVVSN
jgi:regulator of chromosome condensation